MELNFKSNESQNLYLSVNTGTSADNLDCSIINLEPEIKFIYSHSHPIEADIKQQIINLAHEQYDEINQIMQLDNIIAEHAIQAINETLKGAKLTNKDIKAIAWHGQTIRHRPYEKTPYSLQIGNSHQIAQATNITVISDFRSRDLVCGGQGAPLAPAFHQDVFSHKDKNRIIINLGGFANISFLPKNSKIVSGFDSGPANVLLDAWHLSKHQESYDNNGRSARQGKVIPELLEMFLSSPYFLQAPPKSTGREEFNLAWVIQHLACSAEPIADADVAATLVELTAVSISNAIKNWIPDTPDEIFVCGGGVNNDFLIERLSENCQPTPIASTEDLNIDPNHVENALFAWLAHRTLNNKKTDLQNITGSNEPCLLGVIYPV